MLPSELYLGDKRVGYGSKVVPHQIEGVKWLFADITGVPITGLGDEPNPVWDINTKTLTAGSNVALPAVAMYPNSVPKATLISDRLYGFVAEDIITGAQVGDTLLLINDNWGYHGLYKILDKGQNGVSPFVLEYLDGLADRGNPYEVTFPPIPNGAAFNRLTVNFFNDYFENGLDYWYPGWRMWHSEWGVAYGYNAKAVRGVAIGNYSWNEGGVAAIGNQCYVNDPAIVGISSYDGDYVRGGAYVRKFRRNIPDSSYNIERRDEGAILRFTNSGAVTATVRTTATIADWYLGAQLELLQAGTGLVTAIPAVGVTITGPVTTDGPGSRLLLFCVAENVWESTRVSAKTHTVGTTAGTLAAGDDTRFPGYRTLAPVKWVWANPTNAVPEIPIFGTDGTDIYNPTTQELTATTNVAIPTPTSSGVWESRSKVNGGWFNANRPVGSPENVAAGIQVGDRILWADIIQGQQGVYTVLDLGENGVRPYKLKRASDHNTYEALYKNWAVSSEPSPTGYSPPITFFQLSIYIDAGFTYNYSELSAGIGVITPPPLYSLQNSGGTALGMGASAYQFGSYAAGNGAEAFAMFSGAIGSGAINDQQDTVLIDSLSGVSVRRIPNYWGATTGAVNVSKIHTFRPLIIGPTAAMTFVIDSAAGFSPGDVFEITNTGTFSITITGAGSTVITGDLVVRPGNYACIVAASSTGWIVRQTYNTNSPLELGPSTDPAPTSKLQIYAKTVSGRSMLKGMQPSGRDYPYQPAFFQNVIWMVTPNTTTSVTTSGGAVTSTGTLSTVSPATVGSTVFPFSTNFVSAATGNATAGTGMAATQVRHSAVSGALGGFFFQTRLGFPDASYASSGASTGWRFFCGSTSGTMAAAVTTATPTGDFAGFHLVDDGTAGTETTFFFATRNNTTTTRTDTTMPFVPQNVYDFYIFSKVGDSSTIWWRIDNLTANTSIEGTATATLPRTTVTMRVGFQISAVALVARNIRMSRIYCESDY